MKKTICLLPGDGIGPEIVAQGVAVLEAVAKKFGHEFDFVPALIGGAAIDATGEPLPVATVEACQKADAVYLGAVGGPKLLLADRGCPFFKRRSFFTPYADELRRTDGQAAAELYDYLKSETDYPVDDLLRALLPVQPVSVVLTVRMTTVKSNDSVRS